MSDFIEHAIASIRKRVGDKAQVIGAVSGGVDSTVVARLMKEAIGKFCRVGGGFAAYSNSH